jgi:hypothetical protein
MLFIVSVLSGVDDVYPIGFMIANGNGRGLKDVDEDARTV